MQQNNQMNKPVVIKLDNNYHSIPVNNVALSFRQKRALTRLQNYSMASEAEFQLQGEFKL